MPLYRAVKRALLGAILGKHFFVEVIWVPVYRPLEQKRGSVLEVCGTQLEEVPRVVLAGGFARRIDLDAIAAAVERGNRRVDRHQPAPCRP